MRTRPPGCSSRRSSEFDPRDSAPTTSITRSTRAAHPASCVPLGVSRSWSATAMARAGARIAPAVAATRLVAERWQRRRRSPSPSRSTRSRSRRVASRPAQGPGSGSCRRPGTSSADGHDNADEAHECCVPLGNGTLVGDQELTRSISARVRLAAVGAVGHPDGQATRRATGTRPRTAARPEADGRASARSTSVEPRSTPPAVLPDRPGLGTDVAEPPGPCAARQRPRKPSTPSRSNGLPPPLSPPTAMHQVAVAHDTAGTRTWRGVVYEWAATAPDYIPPTPPSASSCPSAVTGEPAVADRLTRPCRRTQGLRSSALAGHQDERCHQECRPSTWYVPRRCGTVSGVLSQLGRVASDADRDAGGGVRTVDRQVTRLQATRVRCRLRRPGGAVPRHGEVGRAGRRERGRCDHRGARGRGRRRRGDRRQACRSWAQSLGQSRSDPASLKG